ncbi:peptidoglycan-binding protein [Thioclava sp. SK-1]|nr:peptidoglycan-binding protein [Thioclava sp. SK-1]
MTAHFLTVSLLVSATAAVAQPEMGGQVSVGAMSVPAVLLPGFVQAVAEGAASDDALADFYAQRDYAPLWTSGADTARRAALFRALDVAASQGLPSARYDAAGLRAQFHALRSERERGLLEAQMSRAYLMYAHDVTNGVLEPHKIDPTIVRDIIRRPSADLIAALADADDPMQFLHSLAPKSPQYAQLIKARLDLQTQIETGGWGPTVPGKKLSPGDSGTQVIALRDRLQRMGYLNRSATASYDDAMQKAVQQYQIDLGLIADGVAGTSTLAEINQSPDARMKSILVALERLRWLNGLELGQRHIWVNIADFSVRIIDDGKTSFQSVTVVGQDVPDRRTPEFSDTMEKMVINPSWYVPRSIVTKEYLPMMQKNRNAAGQLDLLDSRGRVVPRASVNFAQYNARNFPYSMKQPPSDRNALGLVKFLFPNKYNIYLHDTPSKSLFNKEVRAFSHGCVRVGKPFEFAYALLAPQSDDPKAEFQRILKTGKEATVFLENPIPVHLVYFTAWPTARGKMEYRRDVYGRDAALYDGLIKAGVETAALSN